MTTEELRVLKQELKQLNVELNKFRGDLLAARNRELTQLVRKCARKPSLKVHETGVLIHRDIN